MKNSNSQLSPFTDNTGNPVFGLGTSQIASLGRRLDFNKAVELFKFAFNNNISIIDTASSYGSGDAEYLIGKVLKEINFKPFIITKAGFPYAAYPQLFSPLNQISKKIKEKLKLKKKYSPDYLLNTLDKSIERLQVKQIGAFLLHEPAGDELKGTNCWETLAEMKAGGKVQMTGISSSDEALVKEGIDSGAVDVVQASIQFDNKNSAKIIEMCQSKGIPVIANEVFRPFNFKTYNFQKIVEQVAVLPGLEKISPFQLLAALTCNEFKVNCILLGTKNINHLSQNIESSNYFSAVNKNADEIKKIFSVNRNL